MGKVLALSILSLVFAEVAMARSGGRHAIAGQYSKGCKSTLKIDQEAIQSASISGGNSRHQSEMKKAYSTVYNALKPELRGSIQGAQLVVHGVSQTPPSLLARARAKGWKCVSGYNQTNGGSMRVIASVPSCRGMDVFGSNIHELCHQIAFSNGMAIQNQYERLARGRNCITSSYSKTNKREQFAEACSAYMLMPKKLGRNCSWAKQFMQQQIFGVEPGVCGKRGAANLMANRGGAGGYYANGNGFQGGEIYNPTGRRPAYSNGLKDNAWTRSNFQPRQQRRYASARGKGPFGGFFKRLFTGKRTSRQ